MPVEHHHTMKAGTIRQLVFVYATDERAPDIPRTGLQAQVGFATAAFVRDGERTVHRSTLAIGLLGEWSSGSFTEVDRDLMPGVYQVALPDEMLAPGATRAMLSLRFPDAFIEPIDVSLVAFDPQDAERLGVWGLANAKRHEFLRRALPRFTEMELALGESLEGALREQLTPGKDG